MFTPIRSVAGTLAAFATAGLALGLTAPAHAQPADAKGSAVVKYLAEGGRTARSK